jgi:hypothetical protein
MIGEAQRTSLIRIAGRACNLALLRGGEANGHAAIVNVGRLVKTHISPWDIAKDLLETRGQFATFSVSDILNKRVPGVLKGGMVVTGYSGKFLRDDLKIRKITRDNLKNNDNSVESKIQSYVRNISEVQKEDFKAGRLWFLILSETLPHAEVFKDYCWWANGIFDKDWAVAELRYSGWKHDTINLINFKNDTNKWVKTKTFPFHAWMLD